MFNHDDIIRLHRDKEYKRTNRFLKNVRISFGIIKSGDSQFPLDYFNPSITTVVIYIFWIVIKYWVITMELVTFRSKIIEGILDAESGVPNKDLIRDSFPLSPLWLEYKKVKLEYLRKACTDYLNIHENNEILLSHSSEDRIAKIKALNDAQQSIKRIFEEEIKEMEFSWHIDNYLSALNFPEFREKIRDINLSCSNGNLTN